MLSWYYHIHSVVDHRAPAILVDLGHILVKKKYILGKKYYYFLPNIYFLYFLPNIYFLTNMCPKSTKKCAEPLCWGLHVCLAYPR